MDEGGITRARKQVSKALNQLNIPNCTPIVFVSMLKEADAGVVTVKEAIKTQLYTPKRVSSGKFVMSVDHCFPIKGKGNVMTGTVVDGACR